MRAVTVAVMAVPTVVLLIPKFLVINQLGIYDSYAGMILPLLVDAAGVFIMKNFFESIPVSVEEQARFIADMRRAGDFPAGPGHASGGGAQRHHGVPG